MAPLLSEETSFSQQKITAVLKKQKPSVKLKFFEPQKRGGEVFARLDGYRIGFSNGARKRFSDFLVEDAGYVIATNGEDETDKRIFIARDESFPDQSAFKLKCYGGTYLFNARSLLRQLCSDSFSGYRAKVSRETIEGTDFIIINPAVKLGKC